MARGHASFRWVTDSFVPYVAAQPQPLKSTLMLAIPMALDLVATILLSVGLLVTTASVSQMLRGSGMLFAALFALTFLKRRLNRCAPDKLLVLKWDCTPAQVSAGRLPCHFHTE